MRVEAPITRLKFDREVQRILRHTDLLRSWGCFLLRHDFPQIDAIFVPSTPIVIEHQVQRQVFIKPTVERHTYYSLVGRSFGVRVHLDDFDVRAPSVTFHDPFTWKPAPHHVLPTAFHRDADGVPRPVLLDNHPIFGRPFLCLPGLREFHEHPQHSSTDWFSRRHKFGAFAILEMIASTCCGKSKARISFPGDKVVKIDWVLED